MSAANDAAAARIMRAVAEYTANKVAAKGYSIATSDPIEQSLRRLVGASREKVDEVIEAELLAAFGRGVMEGKAK